MKKASIFLLSALLVSPFSFSKNLEEQNILYLFKKYEEKADLSNQTKRESLGHVIVFTRKDLDIMQANYLSDVLKLVPLSNFGPNEFGVESLTNAGELYKISTKYRLYINDHEISSIATYSPFLTYDRYPLDNIDHIEIYFTPGAIAVSNEPSQMIIKMYTKTPERENVNLLRGILDSKSSYTFSFFSGKKLKNNTSYLFTLNHAKIDFQQLFVNGKNISRNQERTHLFFQYRKEDWYVGTSASYVKRNSFSGFSQDGSPDSQHMISKVGFISITKYFLEDKSLKTNFAYDIQNRNLLESNKSSDDGVSHPAFWPEYNLTSFHENKIMHKIAFTINKEWYQKDNELLVGAFVRYYKQDVDKFNVEYLDGAIKRDEKNSSYYNVVKYFWISSLYAENKHNINENNLLIIGARLDEYKFEGSSEEQKINARIGIISYPKKDWLIKGFITQGYILPSLFTVEANKDKKLKPTNFIAYTLETNYKINSHFISGFFSVNKIENFPQYNPTTQSMENSKDSYSIYFFALRYIWEINPFNRFEVNIWKSEAKGNFKNCFSPNLGGNARLLTEYKSWQFYNELVFKDKYSIHGREIPATFNYTFGISKSLKNGWKLRLKGENVFNNSAKIVYKPISGSPIEYQAFDRRFLLTLEKVF